MWQQSQRQLTSLLPLRLTTITIKPQTRSTTATRSIARTVTLSSTTPPTRSVLEGSARRPSVATWSAPASIAPKSTRWSKMLTQSSARAPGAPKTCAARSVRTLPTTTPYFCVHAFGACPHHFHGIINWRCSSSRSAVSTKKIALTVQQCCAVPCHQHLPLCRNHIRSSSKRP